MPPAAISPAQTPGGLHHATMTPTAAPPSLNTRPSHTSATTTLNVATLAKPDTVISEYREPSDNCYTASSVPSTNNYPPHTCSQLNTTGFDHTYYVDISPPPQLVPMTRQQGAVDPSTTPLNTLNKANAKTTLHTIKIQLPPDTLRVILHSPYNTIHNPQLG